MKTRNFLYLVARLMGDAEAGRKGTVVTRIQRRLMGRFAGKTLFRRLFNRK